MRSPIGEFGILGALPSGRAGGGNVRTDVPTCRRLVAGQPAAYIFKIIKQVRQVVEIKREIKRWRPTPTPHRPNRRRGWCPSRRHRTEATTGGAGSSLCGHDGSVIGRMERGGYRARGVGPGEIGERIDRPGRGGVRSAAGVRKADSQALSVSRVRVQLGAERSTRILPRLDHRSTSPRFHLPRRLGAAILSCEHRVIGRTSQRGLVVAAAGFKSGLPAIPPRRGRVGWQSYTSRRNTGLSLAGGGKGDASSLGGLVISLRQLIVLVAGIAIALAGARLRWSARDLAWQGVMGYSGPRADTVNAFEERAYEDFGIIALQFGLALVFAVVVLWLWDGRLTRRTQDAGRSSQRRPEA